jgi:hypothetical protein
VTRKVLRHTVSGSSVLEHIAQAFAKPDTAGSPPNSVPATTSVPFWLSSHKRSGAPAPSLPAP